MRSLLWQFRLRSCVLSIVGSLLAKRRWGARCNRCLRLSPGLSPGPTKARVSCEGCLSEKPADVAVRGDASDLLKLVSWTMLGLSTGAPFPVFQVWLATVDPGCLACTGGLPILCERGLASSCHVV